MTITQTPRTSGQMGCIEVINASMFSGETDIYEACCRRCYEPPQEGQREE